MMFEKPTYVPFAAPLSMLQALGDMLQEPVGKSRVVKNKDVLLTGAGGFLGVHLIEELRRRKKNQVRTIYASVRSKSRAIETAKECGFDAQLWEDRVVFIEGDLNNLDESCFPKVGLVIHGAAQVHALRGLTALWDDNVATTRRMLRMYQGSAFCFVSSLSVFVSSNRKGAHAERVDSKTSKVMIYGGYAQSKALCEHLVVQGGGRVLRLGLVTASTTSQSAPKGFLKTFIEEVRRMGVYPKAFEEAKVDVSPVDLVCKEIWAAIEGQKKVAHIASKNAYRLSKIIRRLGVKGIDKVDWLERVSALPSLEQQLLKMAFFKSDETPEAKKTFNVDVFQSTGHDYGVRDASLIDEDDSWLDVYLN